MFRAQSAHHQEVNDADCTNAASGIVTLQKWVVFYVIYVNEQEICVSSW